MATGGVLPYLVGAGVASVMSFWMALYLIQRFWGSKLLWQRILAWYGVSISVAIFPVWGVPLLGYPNTQIRLGCDLIEQVIALACMVLMVRRFKIGLYVVLGYITLWSLVLLSGYGFTGLRLFGAVYIFIVTLAAIFTSFFDYRVKRIQNSIIFWTLATFLLRFPAQIAIANWVHLTVELNQSGILWLYYAVSILPGIISSVYIRLAAGGSSSV